MENVINHGTGFAVRALGFTAPAAGKTGTSHDAWFAGFTSNLICIVWVGNDDYSDIKIEGAHAAAPIWAEFMKRAVELPQYSDTKEFVPPPGIVEVRLDKATNLLADAACPSNTYDAAFLEGTQPTDTCDHANGDQRNLFQRIFGLGEKPAAPPQVPITQTAPQLTQPIQPAATPNASVAQTQPSPEPQQSQKEARILQPDLRRQEGRRPEPGSSPLRSRILRRLRSKTGIRDQGTGKALAIAISH